MYVVARTRRGKLGQLARSHRTLGIDWGSILQTGIQTAGQVATVAESPTGAALAPKNYSVIPTSPYYYGSNSLGTMDPSTLLLFGGLALAAFVFLSRR